jgi:hypothetical protein
MIAIVDDVEAVAQCRATVSVPVAKDRQLQDQAMVPIKVIVDDAVHTLILNPMVNVAVAEENRLSQGRQATISSSYIQYD